VTAGLAASIAPAAASAAATRYAAPSAQGTGNCSSAANACPISTAVSGASNDDTIYVLGNLGDYNLGAGNVNSGATTLHFIGINGRPRLIGTGNNYTLVVGGPSTTVSNLYLENDNATGGGTSIGLAGGTASVDRVFVKVTGTGHACFLGGGVTLSNSVCWQSNASASDLAIETEEANTMRNDVAWVSGGGVGIRCFGRSGVTGDDTLINTIVRVMGAGGHDLAASSDGSATATFNVSYSNFGTTVAEATTSMDHFNTDSTDQNSAPALVNPTVGDFHELSTSPTINAGVTQPANGAQDLDGNPRTVNGKTDIGAYERGTPGTTPSIVNLVPPNTRIRKSRIKRHKHRATFTFTSTGTAKSFTTGFQCALVRKKKGKHHKKRKPHFTSCRSPKTYKHLRHGKYTFEVRAVDAAGADATPATKTFRI